MNDPLRVELATQFSAAELKHEWLALEARSQPSFFLSWSWIGTWVDTLPEDIQPQLLRARRGERTVGLALVVTGRIRSLPLIGGRGLWLHATGRSDIDGIAIEHNGCLVDDDEAGDSEVWAAMLEYLCRGAQPWRRVTLPHLHHRAGAVLAQAAPGLVIRRLEEPSWIVDLGAVRERSGGYLAMLDTDTRRNLRRTREACEAFGAIEVSVAADLDTARLYLDRLAQLHARRWEQRDEGSSFTLPFAQRFHAALIEHAFPKGEIQLLRITAGGRDLAYFYNFVHRGRVSYYQSGVDYALVDPKWSPGLLAVALAVQHNAALGHGCFDFLGGAGHYKRRLATHHEVLRTVIIDRDGLRHRLEQQLRSWLLPRLKRLSGDARNWRRWVRKWLGRIGLGVTVPLLVVALDACSDRLEPPPQAVQPSAPAAKAPLP